MTTSDPYGIEKLKQKERIEQHKKERMEALLVKMVDELDRIENKIQK